MNIDYHIQFDSSFYSVPYSLARQTVEVRSTPTTIEIFHKGQRVASHLRARKPYTAVTNTEHRPASHRAHLDWPPSRMIQWAHSVGPRTAEMVEKILEAFPHPDDLPPGSAHEIIRHSNLLTAQFLPPAVGREQVRREP